MFPIRLKSAFLSPLLLILAGLAYSQSAHFSYSHTTWGSLNAFGVAVDGKGDIFIADSSSNAVAEIPSGCVVSYTGGPSCIEWIYGFMTPTGVAVDGSGNLFVANEGNSTVKEVLAVNGSIPSSPTIKTLGSGFEQPWGIAVDSNDDVYVVDVQKAGLYEIPAASGYSTVKTIASGLTNYPHGVAVDASGNIFLAGWTSNEVNEYVAPGYTTVKTLGGGWGFKQPSAVALDGAGNLYEINYQDGVAYELLKSSGYNTVLTVDGGLNQPYGLAADANGDVFFGDTGNAKVVKLAKSAGNFGAVARGTSSAIIAAEAIPMTFIFDTAGVLGSTAVLTEGATGLDFTDTGTGYCPLGSSYSAGQACKIVVSFNPSFDGLRRGAVVLKNQAGAIFATGYLSGIGAGPQMGFPPYKQRSVGGGFVTPAGVVADGSGNLFVADTGNNKVKEIPAGCASANCIVPLGSGFSAPGGMALDGAGNLFVADTGNKAIKELLAPSHTTVVTLGSGFSAPSGVAIDGNGNLFVSDAGNSAVKELVADGGVISSSNPTITTLGSGFAAPGDVAVDADGNIFIADTGNSAVKEIMAVNGVIPALNPTINALGSGFSGPAGVSVDWNGNVFVGDAGNSAVKEILAVNGVIPANNPTINTMGSGFSHPSAINLDAGGDIFLADVNNDRIVKLDIADPPTLNFPTPTAMGSKDTTDGTQWVTIENIGTNSLGMGYRFSLNFNDDYSGAANCVDEPSVAVGSTCAVGVLFEPSAILNNSLTSDGTLTIGASNGSPVTIQTATIPLNAQLAAGTTTTALKSSLNPSTYGQSVTFSATVAEVGAGTTPAGTVQFNLNNGPMGKPVTLSGGIASYTTSTLAAPSAAITAAYTPAGGGAMLASTSPILTQTIKTLPDTIKLTPSATAITMAQAMTMTAAVSGGSGNPVPTGSVTLYSPYGYNLSATLSNGSATVSIPASWVGWAWLGVNTLTVYYTPDSASSSIYGSTSTTVAIAVVATPTVTATPLAASITTAQPLPVTVAVSGGSGNPAPTGSVTIRSGSFTSSAVVLSSGSAIVVVPSGSLAVTTDMLTAYYTPDTASASTYAASEGTASVTVTPAPPLAATTTTLAIKLVASTVTTVKAGSAITLTASVLSNGAAVTAGMVDFCDAAATHCADTHLLGTAQLTQAGTATLKFRPGIGEHSYKALFHGVTSKAASSSTAQSLAVTGAYPTTTAFTQSGAPGAYLMTATVTGFPNRPTAAALTGTVNFIDTTNSNALLTSGTLGATAKGFGLVSAPVSMNAIGLSIATADYNRDGFPDLAVLDGGTVSIFLGNGDGTFTAAKSNASAGAASNAMVEGDFNGDGIADLAVVNFVATNYKNATVAILLGNGDGTFTATVASPAVPFNPDAIAMGDFNGDGIEDLAVANTSNNTLTILLGNGDGTFSPFAASPVLGKGAHSIAVGNFNSDSIADMAVTNATDNTVTILLGHGDGTFTTAATLATGAGPSSVAVGDFNGDGHADLTIVSSSATVANDTVTILMGNGDGTFTHAASPASIQSSHVSVADFNQDGNLDLAITNVANSTMTILLGNGKGAFTMLAAPPTVTTSPLFATVADYNGDGTPDLAVTGGTGQLGVSVLLSTLTQSASAAPSTVESPVGVGPHLVTANYSGSSAYAASLSPANTQYEKSPGTTTALALTSGGKAVSTIAEGGTVSFTATVKTGSSPMPAGRVNFCDASTKSCTDIHLLGSMAVNKMGTATIKLRPAPGIHTYNAVYVNNKNGQESTSGKATLTVTPPTKTATTTTLSNTGSAGNYTLTAVVTAQQGAGGVDGDVEFKDDTTKESLGSAPLTLDAADLTFPVVNTYTFVNPSFVVEGDFNGDGIPDLAVFGSGDPELGPEYGAASLVQIMLGKGDGSFNDPLPAQHTPVNIVDDAVAGDLNGDGIDDLLITSAATDIGGKCGQGIMYGGEDGILISAPSYTAGDDCMDNLVLGDFNGDGILDMAAVLGPTEMGGDSSLVFEFGNREGTFDDYETVYIGNIYNLVAGDFNGDGLSDLAYEVLFNSNGKFSYMLQVGLSNGDGFATHFFYPVQGGAMAAADFNGDGNLDLIVQTTSIIGDSPAVLTVLLGDGKGDFTPAEKTITMKNPVEAITPGDFNGDGIPDLYLQTYDATAHEAVTVILLGNGDGSFTPAKGTFPTWFGNDLTGDFTKPPAIKDFNGDGISDFAETSAYSLTELKCTTCTVSVALTKLAQTLKATLNDVAPEGTGTHEAEADYSGSENFLPSSSAEAPLTATKTPPITWSTPAAIVYGNALSAKQLNASCKIAGRFVYSPASGAILAAGTQTLSVTFTPSVTGYRAVTTTVKIAVNKAVLTVAANNASVLYGKPLPKLTYTVTGFVNKESVAVLKGQPHESTTAVVNSPAGSYPITVTQGTLAAANYSFIFKNGTLTITPTGNAATAQINPAPENYHPAQSSVLTKSAAIHFNVEGTTPTAAPSKHAKAIAVAKPERFKAIRILSERIMFPLFQAGIVHIA